LARHRVNERARFKPSLQQGVWLIGKGYGPGEKEFLPKGLRPAALTSCNMEGQSAPAMAGKHRQSIDIRGLPDSGDKSFRKAILLGNWVRGVLNGDKRAEEGKESGRP
jgi:hypothetical protein